MSCKSVIFRTLSTFIFCAVSLPTFAKFKDIVPVADAEVSESAPTQNYGDSTTIGVQSADGTAKNKRIWLKFEISGKIPANAVITSASLRLYEWGADSDGDDLQAQVLGNSDDSWEESAINWDTQPGGGAIDGTFISSPAQGGTTSITTLQPYQRYRWYDWDVTDFVVSEISGDGTVTLAVKAEVENDNQWRTFKLNSREYNTHLAPRLRIEYDGSWPSADSVTILHFNDFHSRLTPHDLDLPDGVGESPVFEQVGGISYFATKMMELKGGNPQALILEAGDRSEGNPLGDLRDNDGIIDVFTNLDAQLKTMPGNASGRGIDALVIGNHDVRSAATISQAQSSSLPFISVNIVNEGAGVQIPGQNPAGNTFSPYKIVEVDNDGAPGTVISRIAILGYTTDDSAHLTDETEPMIDVLEVRWSDDDASTIDLKDWVEHLRKPIAEGGEEADIVILLSHIGHRRYNATDDMLLGDQGDVAPPDVVVSGHWHSWTETAWQPSNLNYNTTIVEAASYGQYIGELNVTPQGRYVSATKHPVIVSELAPNAQMDAIVSDFIAEYDAVTSAPCVLPPAITGRSTAQEPCPLDFVVGHSADDLSLDKDKWFTLSEFPWSGDNKAGAWVADSMVWKVNDIGQTADLAFQSGGGIRRDVAKGEVTFLEIYETYPWNDDQMVKVQLTSQNIWDYIESHYVGSSVSAGWSITADDGIVTAISYDQDGAGPLAPTHLDRTDATTMFDVVISEYMYEHDDWISESGSNVSFQSQGIPSTPLGISIRDSVIEYTYQYDSQNPMQVDGPRYNLNTELAGGFRAVVTLVNDAESQPYFEAVFIRLIEALPETVARRTSYGLEQLVNEDGSINPEHQFAETMLYRSHLGFPDGYLKVGDIIEVWGEGGFYSGNPQLVDQQGIVGAEEEFTITGYDPDLAQPEYYPVISEFWTEFHENHLVKFYAEKISDKSVRDSNGDVITIYKEGGYYSVDVLPGNIGDTLELIGVQTHRATRSPDRRFRLREANLVNGYPPYSQMDEISTNPEVGVPMTLSATAGDINGMTTISCHANGNPIAYTSFEEPSTGGKYDDDNTASHSLANIAGMADVIYTSIGGELGFSAYFTNNGGTGLSDADYIGVTNYTGNVSQYTDGSQGYQLSDTDGIVTVSLDNVDLSSYQQSSVCIDVFVPETSWETSSPADNLRIWVDDGVTEIDLLSNAGGDIDNITVAGSALEGVWHTIGLDLSGKSSAILKFELEANSSSEALYVDNVVFTDSAWTGGGTTQNEGTVTQVEFFYSTDGGLTFQSAGVDTDGTDGWSVQFTPAVDGDYQFYSIATDAEGIAEPAPIIADQQSYVEDDEPYADEEIPLPLWANLLFAAFIGLAGIFKTRSKRK